MGYTKVDWNNRLRERTDMSTSLVHLTRRTDAMDAGDVLVNILRECRLEGSTTDKGFICGNTPAVCFQDAPIYSVCQNVLFEQKMREAGKFKKVRYQPIGIAFPKPYLYSKGARPVVYDRTDDAKGYLDPSQHWRIVSLDLSDDAAFVDWTHEREWRLPGNLEFDLSEATVLAVDQADLNVICDKYYRETNSELRAAVRGIVTVRDILY